MCPIFFSARDEARLVTVRGLDNAIDAIGDVHGSVALTTFSNDTRFNNLTANVTVTVLDNDVAGVRLALVPRANNLCGDKFVTGALLSAGIEETIETCVLEDSLRQLEYTMQLSSEPISPVAITVERQVVSAAVSSSFDVVDTVYFDSTNWKVPTIDSDIQDLT